MFTEKHLLFSNIMNFRNMLLTSHCTFIVNKYLKEIYKFGFRFSPIISLEYLLGTVYVKNETSTFCFIGCSCHR